MAGRTPNNQINRKNITNNPNNFCKVNNRIIQNKAKNIIKPSKPPIQKLRLLTLWKIEVDIYIYDSERGYMSPIQGMTSWFIIYSIHNCKNHFRMTYWAFLFRLNDHKYNRLLPLSSPSPAGYTPYAPRSA